MYLINKNNFELRVIPVIDFSIFLLYNNVNNLSIQKLIYAFQHQLLPIFLFYTHITYCCRNALGVNGIIATVTNQKLKTGWREY